MAEDTKTQLVEKIKRSKLFAIQLDESTDIQNNSILLTYVWYIDHDDSGRKEDILSVSELPKHTTSSAVSKVLNNFSLQSDIYCIVKLHLRTAHAHMNCLSSLCTVYRCDKWDRCVANQDVPQFDVKHDIHKLLTVFSVLSNLTSLIFAACDGTAVRYTTWRRAQFGVISRCLFRWCENVVGFQFHTSAALSLVSIEYYIRDSAVGTATHYGVYGTGFEYRYGQDIPHPSRTSVGPPSLLNFAYPFISGGKEVGAWRWPYTTSSVEVI